MAETDTWRDLQSLIYRQRILNADSVSVLEYTYVSGDSHGPPPLRRSPIPNPVVIF